MSNNDKLELKTFADFLANNPTIFQQYPELLERISLSDNRTTSSLLERQISVLKERLNSQKMAQAELFQNAKENEDISNQFSDVINQLIGCENLSQFASEFPRVLRQQFAIDQVSIKTAASASRRPSETQVYEDALRRLSGNRALCDNRWPSQVMQLFFSEEITSAALIPLRTDNATEPLGILALGSRDSERYTHDLGTAHLDSLGLMAGVCLRRLQPQSVRTQGSKTKSVTA